MKKIETHHAVEHVLCHDVTQIIKDKTKGPVFRKGHIVTEEDIPVLLSVGRITSMYGKKMRTCSMKMKRRRSFLTFARVRDERFRDQREK